MNDGALGVDETSDTYVIEGNELPYGTRDAVEDVLKLERFGCGFGDIGQDARDDPRIRGRGNPEPADVGRLRSDVVGGFQRVRRQCDLLETNRTARNHLGATIRFVWDDC